MLACGFLLTDKKHTDYSLGDEKNMYNISPEVYNFPSDNILLDFPYLETYQSVNLIYFTGGTKSIGMTSIVLLKVLQSKLK